MHVPCRERNHDDIAASAAAAARRLSRLCSRRSPGALTIRDATNDGPSSPSVAALRSALGEREREVKLRQLLQSTWSRQHRTPSILLPSRDPRCHDPRFEPRLHRRFGGQRRTAGTRGRSSCQSFESSLGDQCVFVASGCIDLTRGRSRRSFRPSSRFSRRAHDVYVGIRDVCCGTVISLAPGRTRPTRLGSCDANAEQPRDLG
jgi:hypothetical protein